MSTAAIVYGIYAFGVRRSGAPEFSSMSVTDQCLQRVTQRPRLSGSFRTTDTWIFSPGGSGKYFGDLRPHTYLICIDTPS